MGQFCCYETRLRNVQQPLNLAHQVKFMVVQAAVGIHHLPHFFDQGEALFRRPCLVKQGRKPVQVYGLASLRLGQGPQLCRLVIGQVELLPDQILDQSLSV
ncbi:MAG: hypothetical protein Ct9H300mP16_18610 [Pseudomonadota bacterium]|nr:MAG: hypothetical protein Ct9H300mP16_18610 [Pseudomonadota bacterium]